jgi:hypothetical protein
MSQTKRSRKSRGLSPVHPAAGAIDIGAAMHTAAVGPDRDILGVDLTQINGLGPYLALKLVGECGTDLAAWPTAKHFTSWLALAPHNKISGGKVLSSKARRTSNRAASLLRLAAGTAGRTDTALGAFSRRLSARVGKAKAITATAPLRLGGLGAVLSKGGSHEGGDDAPAALAGVGERVAHRVDATALPGGVHQLGDGGLDSFVGVRTLPTPAVRLTSAPVVCCTQIAVIPRRRGEPSKRLKAARIQ